MNPVRVLIVFSSSELGGAERSLTRMAVAAKEMSCAVAFDLATLDGVGPWGDWCRSLGHMPVVLGTDAMRDSHGRFGLRALWRLLRLARRNRYAAIYVIGLRAAFALRLLKPWLRGARLVQGVRWNPDSDSRLDRVFRFVERYMGGLIDLYVTNAQASAQTLERCCGVPTKKIRVIYNGLSDLPGQVGQVDAGERSMNVVTVANLNPRKGHAEYLDVIQRIHARLPQARFIFIGRDDMNGRIQQEIASRGLSGTASCAGFAEDVGPWLREACLMVLPSLWGEGCPTSILEGFAHGLPVVAYATDGVPELVDDGRDGLLVAPGDGAALAAAIERILRDPQLARQMGEAGRAKVERKFTLARCVEQHAATFADLLPASVDGER